MKASENNRFLRLFGLCLALAALISSGCAGMGGGMSLDGRSGERILDLKEERELTVEALIDRLDQARVVFIGEQHRHVGQHKNQLAVIKGLKRRRPGVTIGLEIFSRARQPWLDQWVSGRIPAAEFKKLLMREVMDPETMMVYWPLLSWARETGTPLLALNAPREVTALVARSGPDALSPGQRAGIARDLVFGPEDYKTRVARAFESHHGHVDLDNFFAAQIIWDETMAETLALYLQSPQGAGRRVVVILGNEHVYMGRGVPDRLARRFEATQARLISPLIGGDEELTARAADFAWITPPEPEKQRPRLGVVLKTDDGPGLLATSIQKGSEAERIGLKPGDRLIEMDGRKISSPMDLHRAAVSAKADAEHRLAVDRDGLRLEFKFKFKTPDGS